MTSPPRETETLFTRARIVLPDAVVEGSLLVRNGRIADVSPGPSRAPGIDCDGDALVAGLVELHTDHVEGHLLPRPGVTWNVLAALQAHDAQVAASGITTVFDALRVGLDADSPVGGAEMAALAAAIEAASRDDRLRAEHFIHVRCEVSAADALAGFERLIDNPRLRLASLMDHAPGQRQFVDLDAYRSYYGRKSGLSEAAFEALCRRRIAESEANAPGNRRAIAALCRVRGIALASHDDASAAHVAESLSDGVALAEFPTTHEAARLSHEAGLSVLMGAPNIVRGGSHSGNVSARALLDAGTLDILSSDYVPFSLLQAVFLLAPEIGLPRAMRLVSEAPAAAAGFADRGAIRPGLRADLVRVRASPDPATRPPVVRGVWREGDRVA